MGRLSGEELAAFVAASCQRSGVPLRVSDPGSVRDVVVLLTGGAGLPPRQRGPGTAGSDLPADIDTIRVEGSSSDERGSDVDPVDNGTDDRGLPIQVEGGPLSA